MLGIDVSIHGKFHRRHISVVNGVSQIFEVVADKSEFKPENNQHGFFLYSLDFLKQSGVSSRSEYCNESRRIQYLLHITML